MTDETQETPEARSPDTLIEKTSDPAIAAPADWKMQLPEEMRTDPSIAQYKTLESMAKSYLHANRMIGADKVVKPNAKWDDAKWDEFFDATGRPKEAGEYKFDEKMFEGVDLNKDALENDKKIFYEAGLNQRQANKVMEKLIDVARTTQSTQQQEASSIANKATEQLKAEWGGSYDDELHIANQAISALGGDSLRDELLKGGNGNNVTLVKVFNKLGKQMQEDTSFGQGSGFAIRDSSKANAEISALKMDKDFMDVFLDKQKPGHKEAVDKMFDLRAIASKDRA